MPRGLLAAALTTVLLTALAPPSAAGDETGESGRDGAPEGSAPAALPLPAGPIFEEASGSGFSFRYENGADGRWFMPEITCGGAALLDADGDGDLDLFLVQGGPLAAPEGSDPPGSEASSEVSSEAGSEASSDADPGPGTEAAPAAGPREGAASALPSDRLFRNDREPGGALRFTDVTEAAGVADAAYGCGAATGDYDNDGDVDLYVANLEENRLLRNRGDGTFEDVTAAAGAGDDRWSASATFTDYDGDGWLDLFVVNYVVFDPARQKACRTAAGAPDYCNPAAYAGVPNRLLRNRGDGTFEDVSAASGVGAPRGKSLGTVAADLDGDGRTDLYVTNDGEPNELWLQTRPGRFEDGALFAGCAVDGRGQPQASMGVVAEDDDGDGDLDLFLTHLSGETHTLYRGDGAGGCRDGSNAAGLAVPTLPATGWGVAWADLDNDGWLDLAIANGAVRTVAALADAGDAFPFHQPDQLFRNRGGAGAPGRYEEVSDRAGAAFLRSATSRGLAAGDVDDDGDVDLLVVDIDGPARLLLNRVGQERHWLGLRVVGGEGRDALGARVELLDSSGGTATTSRRVASDGSYASARDPRVLFGLGARSRPGPEGWSVRVTWPDGTREAFTGLEPDRYTTLRRGGGQVETKEME